MSANLEAKTPTSEPVAPVPSIPSADPDIVGWVGAAAEAAVDKKALDIKVLHLGKVTDFTDFFLLASGQNARQVDAIAEAIQRGLRDRKVRPLHVEGDNKAQWILLDYGDFICHIFEEEQRAYYALERLWNDAPDVTAQFCGVIGPSSPPSALPEDTVPPSDAEAGA